MSINNTKELLVATNILGIDIGSIKICTAMAEISDSGSLRIVAVSEDESKGIKKGSITNIELAASSIKFAVSEIEKKSGKKYDKVIISISGKDVQESDCGYVMNIPDGEVTLKQIETAVHSAEWRAKIPQDYEIIHTLPYNFKMDEQQDYIEDPLGMNGSRLEVQTYNIAVPKSSLMNLQKALEKAGIKADNVVLSGYASAIATLNDDEKYLGAVVIDMGGDTCNMVVHSKNSIRHSDFLAIGSSKITSDLSTVLHTSIAQAEEIKRKFETFSIKDNELIELPDLGEEHTTHEVDVSLIEQIIESRIKETLMILTKFLEKSGYSQKELGAGVILTGGMTRLSCVKRLANDIFGMSARIARPAKIEGFSDIDRDPAHSCAIGLCLYGAGKFTPYEIDSNRKLRYKGENLSIDKNLMSIKELDLHHIHTQKGVKMDLKIDEAEAMKASIPKTKEIIINPLTKMINWFKNLF